MGKAKRKQHKQHKPRQYDEQPTAQAAGREIARAGLAYRFVPVIETMHRRGQINDKEYTALAYYAEQASIAEQSPVRSCLDFTVRGGGDIGRNTAVLSAQLETARIERDLGTLQPIARAIAVDGMTLTNWCIKRHGSRQRLDSAGKVVAIVPFAEARVMKIAAMELRMAARRIVT